MRKLPIFLITLGLLLLVAYLILGWVIVPMFQGDKVVQGMQSVYGATGGYEHWKKFGLPSYLHLNPPLLYVYLFNVTNPTQIIYDGTKPIVQEVGPYIYNMQITIEAVPSSNNSNNSNNETDIINDTISFREKSTYHFNPELSGSLREEDLVLTLNIPFVKFIEHIGQGGSSNILVGSILASKENGNSLFIKRSVKELLFEGFSQPSLTKSEKAISGGGRQGASTSPHRKFGFLYPKNDSTSKIYTVFTGFTNPLESTDTPSTQSSPVEEEGPVQGQGQGQGHGHSQHLSLINSTRPSTLGYGRILTYDGKPSLDFWAKTEEDNCNRISGTTPDGMLFDPVTKQGATLSVFRPEMCRSLTLLLNGHVQSYNNDGLYGTRYVLPAEAVSDSKDNFENNCYCPNPDSNSFEQNYHIRGCVKGGTLSNCREGLPYVTTLPHFLYSNGTPYLTQTVGLSPDPAKHGSFVDVEPITGLALKSSMKFQLNYELKLSNSFYESLRNVPEMMFPILWTNEVKSLNFILSGGIETNIMTPLKYIEVSKWAALAAGCPLLLIGFLICVLRSRKKNYPMYFNTLMISKESLSPTAAQRQKNRNNRNKSNRKVSFASKISSTAKSLTPSPSEYDDDNDDEMSSTFPSSPVSEPFLDGLQRQALRSSSRSSSLPSSNSNSNGTTKSERGGMSDSPSFTSSDTNTITPNNTTTPHFKHKRNPSLGSSKSSSSAGQSAAKDNGHVGHAIGNGQVIGKINVGNENIKEISATEDSSQDQGQGKGQVQDQGQDPPPKTNIITNNDDSSKKPFIPKPRKHNKVTEISVMLTSDETIL